LLDLAELTGSLPVRPDGRGLVAGFVPPPRFAGKDFRGYEPRHPSQRAARTRLEALAGELRALHASGLPRWLRRVLSRDASGAGTYLDGGFGVGKTHLLAALWNAAPQPKAYLSFDELVYFIGLVGMSEARSAFADRRLIAVDEWELDDPGNLKIALAFLRGAIEDGARVVVTSNTLPLELGAGRFSQKDFQAEIEELAGAFEVLRIEGDDYRHRQFEADPGREYFVERPQAVALALAAGPRALRVPFPELIRGLAAVHPIRYAAIVERISRLFVLDLRRVENLPDALRWVHFVDTLYDSSVPMRASSDVPLGELFPHAFISGPFGKKISRCLSRMEELLSEKEGAS
jgi:cell division protein ZapE